MDLASSINLVVKVVAIEVGQYLCRVLQKTDYFWSFNASSKNLKLKRNFPVNHGKNISKLFHILVQFLFTTSESKEIDYHQ